MRLRNFPLPEKVKLWMNSDGLNRIPNESKQNHRPVLVLPTKVDGSTCTTTTKRSIQILVDPAEATRLHEHLSGDAQISSQQIYTFSFFSDVPKLLLCSGFLFQKFGSNFQGALVLILLRKLKT